ncbi:hypothetical protein C2134_02955 [Chromobacterium sinusclupearum]|uniref:Peptidoglycan endopeptidase n=1 Tax=Chromobacterium sinusclupearum TaxID=2077146 RepID=A0A2K4MT14_9NEIS|nr:hypothetical protein [Chromobacterium sinusclupearum]POB00168.1 hypothetical protein C2134_02955 [Chromobacterium sinusclupearum]
MHWSDRYVGLDYVADTADCAVLASTVARDVLGREIELPGERRPGPFGRNALIQQHRQELARRIDEPMEAQPVLLISRGRAQHIGVMCRLAGEWWVLHADEAAGFVLRQRLRDLPRQGYQVEGFYEWL